MPVEWKKALDFAEMAETLGVTTLQIMGAKIEDDKLLVLYTPDVDDDVVYGISLRRDRDGILQRDCAPVLIPGVAKMIEQLGDDLDA